MNGCTHITREMLTDPIEIWTGAESVSFEAAKNLAWREAHEVADDPMLLAWFDRKTGRYSPDVVCCSYDKPGWLVYAESRGGTIAVDINDEDYVFVYRSVAGSA